MPDPTPDLELQLRNLYLNLNPEPKPDLELQLRERAVESSACGEEGSSYPRTHASSRVLFEAL